MFLHKKPDWSIPERLVTPEAIYLDRRSLLKAMGAAGGATLLGAGSALAALEAETPIDPKPLLHPGFADAGRPVTDEADAASYNNFYEFGSTKRIAKEAQKLPTDPWTITIDGHVDSPFQIGFEDLFRKVDQEERIYRHRCVEAWSMVVPWTGFPLRKLVEMAKPTSDARYLRFETFLMPEIATEQRASWYPWPYVEGMTLAEAMNDLSFMVTGAYGKILHKQFGAPIRLHLPWKYGFKSIKSITRISLPDTQPVSFWEQLQKREYGFWANVNPEVSHPRWSQAEECVLGSDEKIPTLLYNGYEAQVAELYKDVDAGDRLWR
jgi:sulfoxide reductase catalytic subunit YedY